MKIIVTEIDGFESEYTTDLWEFDISEDRDGRQVLEFEANFADEIHRYYFPDFTRLDFIHD